MKSKKLINSDIKNKIWFIGHSYDHEQNYYTSGRSSVIAPDFRSAIKKFYDYMGQENIWSVKEGPVISPKHISLKLPNSIVKSCPKNHYYSGNGDNCEVCSGKGYVSSIVDGSKYPLKTVKKQKLNKYVNSEGKPCMSEVALRQWSVAFRDVVNPVDLCLDPQIGQFRKTIIIAYSFDQAFNLFLKLHPDSYIQHFESSKNVFSIINENDIT